MSNRTWPAFGVLLAILWLFVRGVAATPSALLEEAVLGLVLGMPIAFLLRRLYPKQTDLRRALRASPFAALYAAVFFKELLTANVDVAYRVLAPDMPIRPDVVVIPLRVQTDLAITTIANSITLTPGTLTMDYDEEENVLYVHAIDASDRSAVVDPIRTWERYALVIFDEPGQPGDPVPELPSGGEHGD
ncbi:MAG: Na+/H+ antiporter subunit E [Halobacteriaceae archaeon]